jgi:hypothetical protein
LQTALFAEPFGRVGDANSVRAVFMDDGDLDVVWIGAKLSLGIVGDECDESFAVLVGMNLPAENVLQIFVLEDCSCDRGRDP